MGEKQESVVRALLDNLVAGDLAAVVEQFSNDATYTAIAWHEPIVGMQAIRAEVDRQAEWMTDFRYTIVNMVSTDSIVFAERLETCKTGGKDVKMHISGAMEVEDGKSQRGATISTRRRSKRSSRKPTLEFVEQASVAA